MSVDTTSPAVSGRRALRAARTPKDKSVWHYLGMTLSTALLLLVIALAAIVIVIPKVAGATPMTVLTSSMEPGLPPGTLIIVKPIDPMELRTGDIATYQIRSGVPGVITHRIVAIGLISTGERSFTFQGDNNNAVDEPVRPEQIKGRLWYSIPLLGWVNNAVNGAIRSWIIPLAAGLLFAYAGYAVVSAIYAFVKKRRAVTRLGSNKGVHDGGKKAHAQAASAQDALRDGASSPAGRTSDDAAVGEGNGSQSRRDLRGQGRRR